MNRTIEKICPRCTSQRLRRWGELSDEQKMLAERLPASATVSVAKRKKHRFCTRCWFEENDEDRGRGTLA